ncbi:hypothetical protein KJ966_03200 [bacterium]|nr:hypothetical protein [bacterium]
MESIERAPSVPEVVKKIYQSGFKLNISRLDAAYLMGIHTYLEIQQNFILTPSELERIFAIVNDISSGMVESLPQRFNHAINRLLKNQLLIRVDGGGLGQMPQFDVSALGKSIIGHLSHHETLNRQNLTIIAAKIVSTLSDIRRSLDSSGSDHFWEESVRLPLKHVVAELITAIEKRQKGLDLEQDEVRNKISRLLDKDWLEALVACEELLETTSTTLQELYQTLLSENSAIKQGLNEISDAADQSSQPRVLAVIDGIYLRLDQLEQWGKERVGSWSQYYRRVNDFLQSIVRFDPNREMSQRLVEQIQHYPKSPWFLNLLEPPVYRTLKETHFPGNKKKVTRVLSCHADIEEEDDDGNLVLDLMIEEIKQRLASSQSVDLVEIIRPFLKEHSLSRVYPHIGTLIDLVLKEINQHPSRSSSWEKPLEDLEFELQNLIADLK